MRSSHWLVFACISVAVAACGDDTSSNTAGATGDNSGGAGGTGTNGMTSATGTTATGTTATGTTTSVSVTGTGTTTTGSGMENCRDHEEDFGPDCGPCLVQNCCDEVAACAGDPVCDDCLSTDAEECATNDPLAELGACATNSCATECFPPAALDCNPVTSDGCAAGEACDQSETGFECFAEGNEHNLCETCGENGDYCKATMACLGSVCTRYCCDDADCGTGYCEKQFFDIPDAPLGVCLVVGTDLMAPEPSCDAPAIAPSDGACIPYGMMGTGGAGGSGGGTTAATGTGGAGGAATTATGVGGAGGM